MNASPRKLGGMGVVYKAEDTELGRFVAIKFLYLTTSRGIRRLGVCDAVA